MGLNRFDVPIKQATGQEYFKLPINEMMGVLAMKQKSFDEADTSVGELDKLFPQAGHITEKYLDAYKEKYTNKVNDLKNQLYTTGNLSKSKISSLAKDMTSDPLYQRITEDYKLRDNIDKGMAEGKFNSSYQNFYDIPSKTFHQLDPNLPEESPENVSLGQVYNTLGPENWQEEARKWGDDNIMQKFYNSDPELKIKVMDVPGEFNEDGSPKQDYFMVNSSHKGESKLLKNWFHDKLNTKVAEDEHGNPITLGDQYYQSYMPGKYFRQKTFEKETKSPFTKDRALSDLEASWSGKAYIKDDLSQTVSKLGGYTGKLGKTPTDPSNKQAGFIHKVAEQQHEGLDNIMNTHGGYTMEGLNSVITESNDELARKPNEDATKINESVKTHLGIVDPNINIVNYNPGDANNPLPHYDIDKSKLTIEQQQDIQDAEETIHQADADLQSAHLRNESFKKMHDEFYDYAKQQGIDINNDLKKYDAVYNLQFNKSKNWYDQYVQGNSDAQLHNEYLKKYKEESQKVLQFGEPNGLGVRYATPESIKANKEILKKYYDIQASEDASNARKKVIENLPVIKKLYSDFEDVGKLHVVDGRVYLVDGWEADAPKKASALQLYEIAKQTIATDADLKYSLTNVPLEENEKQLVRDYLASDIKEDDLKKKGGIRFDNTEGVWKYDISIPTLIGTGKDAKLDSSADRKWIEVPLKDQKLITPYLQDLGLSSELYNQSAQELKHGFDQTAGKRADLIIDGNNDIKVNSVDYTTIQGIKGQLKVEYNGLKKNFNTKSEVIKFHNDLKNFYGLSQQTTTPEEVDNLIKLYLPGSKSNATTRNGKLEDLYNLFMKQQGFDPTHKKLNFSDILSPKQ